MKGELKDKIRETHDVMTFIFELDKPINYVPGQFCVIKMDGFEKEHPFTFVKPANGKKIEFTIKSMGEFTEAMHNMNIGDKIEVKEPEGESLNFDKSVKEDVVFLAGGSGITPFMAALRYMIQEDMKNQATLIFSNRKKEDIIFEKELEEMSKKYRIKVIHTLTKDNEDSFKYKHGHIDKEMLETYIQNIDKKIIYICGPPGMVEDLRKKLKEMGVDESAIRWEDWQIEGKHDEEKKIRLITNEKIKSTN
jgi:NAD(P)H-flavin reductase